MKSYDFEYDGATLSNFGYMVCSFDSAGLDTVENGSQITFNTTPIFNGAKYLLTSSTYEDCLQATFQICKMQCGSDMTEALVDTAIVGLSAVGITDISNEEDFDISVEELRTLMKWLNRKGFHKFRLLDDDYSAYYFEGSFNISRIEIDDRLVGLELTLITNRPFALMEPVTITIENTSSDGTASFKDVSDEEGFIYPETEILISESGDLTIYNELEDRYTYIGNCTAGETITMNYPIISTTDSTHEIQNDFNWKFLRIANTFYNSTNNLTISIPCTITMTYSPITKVGL